jgi:hypothetical protein
MHVSDHEAANVDTLPFVYPRFQCPEQRRLLLAEETIIENGQRSAMLQRMPGSTSDVAMEPSVFRLLVEWLDKGYSLRTILTVRAGSLTEHAYRKNWAGFTKYKAWRLLAQSYDRGKRSSTFTCGAAYPQQALGPLYALVPECTSNVRLHRLVALSRASFSPLRWRRLTPGLVCRRPALIQLPSQSDTCWRTGLFANPLCCSQVPSDIESYGGDQASPLYLLASGCRASTFALSGFEMIIAQRRFLGKPIHKHP